jgi:HSP20 family protein
VTSIRRWDPFAELRGSMDRLFDDGFTRPWRTAPRALEYQAGFPVEVSETSDGIEVKALLPGIRPEEVDITVSNGVLTIKAEHRAEKEDKKRDFYRREIRYGGFQRSLRLPNGVDADKADASYENGVLRLQLPKSEALRPKQIKVGSAGDGAKASDS